MSVFVLRLTIRLAFRFPFYIQVTSCRPLFCVLWFVIFAFPFAFRLRVASCVLIFVPYFCIPCFLFVLCWTFVISYGLRFSFVFCFLLRLASQCVSFICSVFFVVVFFLHSAATVSRPNK